MLDSENTQEDYRLAKRLAATSQQRLSGRQLDPNPSESSFGHAFEPKPV
jgi:hypothetical protein